MLEEVKPCPVCGGTSGECVIPSFTYTCCECKQDYTSKVEEPKWVVPMCEDCTSKYESLTQEVFLSL